MQVPEQFVQRRFADPQVVLNGTPLNLREIAKALDIDHSYLSRIFSGERRPRIDYIRRIAILLDMSTDELIDAIDARREIIQALSAFQ